MVHRNKYLSEVLISPHLLLVGKGTIKNTSSFTTKNRGDEAGPTANNFVIF